MLKRIAEASVWAPDGVSAADWRFRGIFRWVLPLANLAFAYFGIVGFLNGVGSVQDAAGSAWQLWWSAGITITSVLCFIGVAFPRLWLLELIAKILMVSLVASYIGLYLSRGAHDPQVTAFAGLITVLIYLPIWRIGDLGVIAWRHGFLRKKPRA